MGFFDTLKREIQVLTTEMDQDTERERIVNREKYDRDTLQTTEASLRKRTEKEIRTLYVERQKSMVNQELRERDVIEKNQMAFFKLIETTEKTFRESAKEGWVDTKDIQLGIDSEDENDFIHLSPIKK